MTSGDNNKKGFDGFDDLVSDVSKEIETPVQSRTSASEPIKTTTTQLQDKSLPSSQSEQPKATTIPQSIPGEGGDGSFKVWVALVIFAVTVVILFSGEKKVDEPADYDSSYQESYAPSATEEAVAAAPSIPANDAESLEEKPPVGSGMILSFNQIRYCLSEDIRLGTIQDALDNYSKNEVDRFNAETRDYNSRCSNFKYRRGTLDAVKTEVNTLRASLVLEGLHRLDSWRGIEKPPNTSKQNSSVETVSELSTSQSSDAKLAQNTEPTLKDLSAEEKGAIESVCSGEKLLNGLKAYDKCVSSQKMKLANTPSPPDLSMLNPDERSSIKTVCNGEKSLYGPAAFYKCLEDQKDKLNNVTNPDLSALSTDEQSSIKSVCNGEKLLYGPAAYYKCLEAQKVKLKNVTAPDLAALSADEKSAIKSFCNGDKLLYGPAAYYNCLTRQKTLLVSGPKAPDINDLSVDERSLIESTCEGDKFLNGPAAYNKCLQIQVQNLR